MSIKNVIKWLSKIFGKKEAQKRKVMVVAVNGHCLEEEVHFTETAKAYVRNGSSILFLDNPDQKEGEIRKYGNEDSPFTFKRWYNI
jgi:hypothetical protein